MKGKTKSPRAFARVFKAAPAVFLFHDASGGAGSRFIIYVNEGSGRHIILPRKTAMRGTCPWTRFECHFSTSADVGKKSGQSVTFQFIKMKGTAWIDHVELCEVQK